MIPNLIIYGKIEKTVLVNNEVLTGFLEFDLKIIHYSFIIVMVRTGECKLCLFLL